MKKLITILFLVQIIVRLSFAQDISNLSHSANISIPEVAILDVEGPGGNSITLSPSFSGEAGDPLDFSGASDNSLWLNYTSILPGSVNRRSISVQMDNTALPQGLRLWLTVAEPTGEGNVGDARNRPLRLRTTPRNVINRIESCYTNNGVGEGSQLTYYLTFNERRFDRLSEFSASVTITYTLFDR